ncbi:hypothetical protein [Cellulomonas edaphi]|uniref:Uncharacterized protein n=1 Tax=Cellulomonas edaphi TaxID=3053468 RepID=A0ABT7S3V1_9CELL|nr:hypothetical protein [Cellulomons edaphi]MDM7830298.1 hypothetical protein [Cellulomons edaphi]
MKVFSWTRRATAVLATVALASTAAVAGASSAGAAACSATRSTSMTVHATATAYDFQTKLDYSGKVEVTERYYYSKNSPIANHTITVLACKDPKTKTWKPLHFTVTARHGELAYRVLDGKAKVDSRGMAVIVNKVGASKVHLTAIACNTKPQKLSPLAVSRALTQIPVPGPYVIGLGQAAAALLLPKAPATKYYCGAVGPAFTASWKLSSTGKASLSFGSTGHVIRAVSTTWNVPTGPYYRSVQTTYQRSIVITR